MLRPPDMQQLRECPAPKRLGVALVDLLPNAGNDRETTDFLQRHRIVGQQPAMIG